MKAITLTMTFNISEKDYKSEEFQEVINNITDGIMQKEVEEESKLVKMKQVKISLTVK